jgi:hypothetical protein
MPHDGMAGSRCPTPAGHYRPYKHVKQQQRYAACIGKQCWVLHRRSCGCTHFSKTTVGQHTPAILCAMTSPSTNPTKLVIALVRTGFVFSACIHTEEVQVVRTDCTSEAGSILHRFWQASAT